MAKKDKLCTACLVEGRPKRQTPGNILIELILWLAFIIPGLIYTLWRHSASYDACRLCGGKELIPPDSPRAMQLLQQKGETV